MGIELLRQAARVEGKIERAIENRTIRLSDKQAARYEKGEYNPFFSLVDRDGELLCMFCGNRKKLIMGEYGKIVGGDIELFRFQKPELGLCTDPKEGKSWNRATRAVMSHYKPRLGDRFDEWCEE